MQSGTDLLKELWQPKDSTLHILMMVILHQKSIIKIDPALEWHNCNVNVLFTDYQMKFTLSIIGNVMGQMPWI